MFYNAVYETIVKVTTFMDNKCEINDNRIMCTVSEFGLVAGETFRMALKVYCCILLL